jgi:hypothetical protein
MRYFFIAKNIGMWHFFEITMSEDKLRFTEPFVVHADFSELENFSDLFIVKRLFTYFFLASERLYKLLTVYEEGITGIPFFITSNDYRLQKVYRKIQIEALDIGFNPSNATEEDLTRLCEAMRGRYIARMCFEKQQCIVVSLHVAEHILRQRYFDGIKLAPIVCKGE